MRHLFAIALTVLALACASETTYHAVDAGSETDTSQDLTCGDFQKLHGAELFCQFDDKICKVETVLTDDGCLATCGNKWSHPSDQVKWSGEHQITVRSNFYGTFWCTVIRWSGK